MTINVGRKEREQSGKREPNGSEHLGVGPTRPWVVFVWVLVCVSVCVRVFECECM